MPMLLLQDVEEKLAERLSPESLDHSLRTRDTAVKLAKRHNSDIEKTSLAALLHDYAKDLSNSDLLSESIRLGLRVNWVEERNPYLLHPRVGAALVETELGVVDPEVISAIAKHTYGDTAMSYLDLIVYLADVIEPGRNFYGLDTIRELAKTDLRQAFKHAYLQQILFVFSKGAYVHPTSVEVWNRLLEMERDNERAK